MEGGKEGNLKKARGLDAIYCFPGGYVDKTNHFVPFAPTVDGRLTIVIEFGKWLAAAKDEDLNLLTRGGTEITDNVFSLPQATEDDQLKKGRYNQMNDAENMVYEQMKRDGGINGLRYLRLDGEDHRGKERKNVKLNNGCYLLRLGQGNFAACRVIIHPRGSRTYFIFTACNQRSCYKVFLEPRFPLMANEIPYSSLPEELKKLSLFNVKK